MIRRGEKPFLVEYVRHGRVEGFRFFNEDCALDAVRRWSKFHECKLVRFNEEGVAETLGEAGPDA